MKKPLPPFSGATFDSRQVKPGMLFVAVKGEKSDGHAYIAQARANGAVGIVDGYEELNRLARSYRRSLRATVVGVTGSAGKTTTKELVKAFLSRHGKVHATEGNFNNHLGLPITILNCPPDADFLVLEMGTNHPGEIAHLCEIAEPDCGILTGVGTAHMEFFGDRVGIAREKGVLLSRVKSFGVVSSDCAHLETLRACGCPQLIEISPRSDWLADALAAVLPGAHNVSNAALAFALAERFGATREQAVAALADFALPGARWRRTKKNGILFIDDTYNANPDAMIAALDTLAALPGGRKVAVLGDMFELGPRSAELHRHVFVHARACGISLVIAVGAQASSCPADLTCATIDELREKLPDCLRPGDVVLLKASHGMRLGEALDFCYNNVSHV